MLISFDSDDCQDCPFFQTGYRPIDQWWWHKCSLDGRFEGGTGEKLNIPLSDETTNRPPTCPFEDPHGIDVHVSCLA